MICCSFCSITKDISRDKLRVKRRWHLLGQNFNFKAAVEKYE